MEQLARFNKKWEQLNFKNGTDQQEGKTHKNESRNRSQLTRRHESRNRRIQKPPSESMTFFSLEKEDDPRPLRLGDAYDHFINYSHKTLQSNTTVRLKLPSKQLYPVDEGAQIAWA